MGENTKANGKATKNLGTACILGRTVQYIVVDG